MDRSPSSSPTSMRRSPWTTRTWATAGRRAGTASASSKGISSRVDSRDRAGRPGPSGPSSTAQQAGAAGRQAAPASFSSLRCSSSVN